MFCTLICRPRLLALILPVACLGAASTAFAEIMSNTSYTVDFTAQETAAKKIKWVESDGLLFRVNAVDEQRSAAADELKGVLTDKGRSGGFDDVVKSGRTQFAQPVPVYLGIFSVDRNDFVGG